MSIKFMEKLSTILVNTNTSDSAIKNTNTKTLVLSLREVQTIANKLEDALGKQIPSRYPLYCKIARTLSESRIWSNLEIVLEANSKGKIRTSPAQFFSYLCSLEMK